MATEKQATPEEIEAAKKEAEKAAAEAAAVADAAKVEGDKAAAKQAGDTKKDALDKLAQMKSAEIQGASESTIHALLEEVRALREETKKSVLTKGFWDDLFKLW